MIARRSFLQTALALTALPFAALAPAAAMAAGLPEPGKKDAQVPGYFRLRLGGVEITALYDGAGKVTPDMLHGADTADIAALLLAARLPAAGPAPTALNCFLVDTGKNLVLVDCGAGGYFGPRAGRLMGNLRAAGVEPGRIDTVLLTHLHSDHARGLTDEAGRPVFPSARLFVSEPEVAYWLSDERLATAPADKRDGLLGLRSALAPYRAADRLTVFPLRRGPLTDFGGPEGIEAVPLPGHTPGHCGFSVRAGKESLLAWGDIVHCAAVQFARPEVTIDYDVDQAQAAATRARVLAEADADGCWLAGAHLPFPALGRVRAQGRGYAWVPAQYAVPSGI
ncbi:beta-lactamase domain protein [Desulfovibrio sp. X2]|uniref:MBL fold metallo-hydrolase n=1 Tax=Desulfovibrio sp. X2 TaxID=941449 RepID=UPI000358EB56|nr:MBL fold metallo-hydrolase [Desulfovibrio sp. X2]EPR37673.1 beta-lactamase domain protein [Desulfovibrio sp. X2]